MYAPIINHVKLYHDHNSHQQLSNGESICNCTPGPLNITCANGYSVCNWYEECSKVNTNDTLSQCVRKAGKLCARFQYLGNGPTLFDPRPNPAVAVQACGPYETCCDGACCTEFQRCVSQEQSVERAPTFIYNYTAYAVTEAAVNNWNQPDSTAFRNRPRICVAGIKPVGGVVIIFLPLLGALLVIGMTVVAMVRVRAELSLRMIPPLVMIVASFFMLFSYSWLYGLLSILIALVTSFTPPHHDQALWLILFQILIFWWVSGGGNFFLSNNDAAQNILNSIGQGNIDKLTEECTTYYGYFSYSRATMNVRTSPYRTAWGFCGLEWITFVSICAVANVFTFSMMIFQTVIDHLSPAQGPDDSLKGCLRSRSSGNDGPTQSAHTGFGNSNQAPLLAVHSEQE